MVQDKVAVAMAEGMVGKYAGQRVMAPDILAGLGRSLHEDGDDALRKARNLVFRFTNQRAQNSYEHNAEQRTASARAKREADAIKLHTSYQEEINDPDGPWKRLTKYAGDLSIDKFMPNSDAVSKTKSKIIEDNASAFKDNVNIVDDWSPEGLIEDAASIDDPDVFVDRYLKQPQYEKDPQTAATLSQIYAQLNNVDKVIANNQNYQNSLRNYSSSVNSGATLPKSLSTEPKALTPEQEARARDFVEVGGNFVRGK